LVLIESIAEDITIGMTFENTAPRRITMKPRINFTLYFNK
jgi:hypothetical protein